MRAFGFGFGFGVASSKSAGGGIPYVGPDVIIIGYGQSNSLRHFNFGSSPAAAVEGTSFWNGTEWTDVPAANGARELLNAVATGSGKTVGLIYGGQAGVGILALMPDAGTGYFESLAEHLVDAKAGLAEEVYIVFHQGEEEGNSVSPPSSATYSGWMDMLHGHIVDVLGLEKEQAPFFCSSLAGWVGGTATDASWNTILTSQVRANYTYDYIAYSHSNRRFPVDLDGAHWNTAAMYGLSGRLYAQSILSWMGLDVFPNWHLIEDAEIVDETHTRVFLSHSMGNDFTPTTGITGFTLSVDGFSTTITPTGGDRVDEFTIELTHESLSLTSDRTIRYQYGKLPDITAPVLDNSPLAVPLNHSAGQTIVAQGAASDPVLTFITANAFPSGGDVQTASNLDLSPATETMALFIAIAHQSDGVGLSVDQLTITAGEEALIGYPFYVPDAGQYPYTEFWIVEVPALTPGIDDAELSVTLQGNPFSRSNYAIAAVPSADLMASSPDSALTATVDGTTRTLEMSVNEAGFIFAVASSAYNGATSATWTGDEPPIEQSDYTNSFGSNFSVAIANGCTQEFEANTVTVTYANSGPMRLTAIALR